MIVNLLLVVRRQGSKVEERTVDKIAEYDGKMAEKQQFSSLGYFLSLRNAHFRAERLAKALSQINATVTTNAPSAFPGADRPVAATPHRNVSVVVIQ